MSEDLIRRSDAIKAIANLHILADEEKIFRVYADNPHSMTTDFEETLIDAINAIKSIPSADRPSGEWIEHKERTEVNGGFIDFFPTEYECSNCGLKQSMYFINSKPSNFCPNCGCAMTEELKVGV